MSDPTGGPQRAALAHLRVVDLTQRHGYASKVFAHFGSDVILVEPPEGVAARRRGPFLDGEAAPSSLHFDYLGGGKRSIVLDLAGAADRAVFADLVATADIVFDDQLQGHWREIGLGYDALARRNPDLVWCAITPFGQDGPWSGLPGDDFIAMATGGMAWLAGYEDTGPLVADGELALYSAAQYAAVMALLAVYGRPRVGGGQFIDISAQEVVVLGTETATQFQELKGVTRRRLGERERQAGIGVYPCKDGAVLLYAAASGLGAGWTNLVRWLVDAKVPGAEGLAGPQWGDNAFKALETSRAAFREIFARFAAQRTKRELFEEGQRRRIAVAPLNDSADVLADPHLNAGGTFSPLAIGGGRVVLAPGAPYRLGVTPWTPCGPAPLLGQQSDDLRRELKPRAAAS